MLMNNLDPEVAERPDDLVVYGGTGRAARSLAGLRHDRGDVARPGERRDAPRPVRQAGRRLPAPTNGRPACSSPTRSSCRTGRRRRSSAASRQSRPHDVRPDDCRKLDLHRHSGHPAGAPTRPSPRSRLHRFGGTLAGRHRPHRRPRAAWAAPSRLGVTMNGGRRHLRRGGPVARRAPARDPVRRRRLHLHRPRRSHSPGRPRRIGGRSRSRSSATPPRSCPGCWPRTSPVDVVTDQTSAHDPSTYVPAGLSLDGGGASFASATSPSTCGGPGPA